MEWNAFEIVRLVLYGLELISGIIVYGRAADVCGTYYSNCSGTAGSLRLADVRTSEGLPGYLGKRATPVTIDLYAGSLKH
jgi:hypothetical protein